MSIPQHSLYKQVAKQQADACAWIFCDEKSDMQEFYYKKPQLAQDELWLRILHTSLCHSDVLTVRGNWGPYKKPFCPGHQIIGEVVQAGPKCKRTVGEVIAINPIRYSCTNCRHCEQGNDNLCDKRQFVYFNELPYFGGYSTHMHIRDQHTFSIPKQLDISVCAPLLCAGITVFAPINRYGKKGHKCAVIGIGGLGHLAIMFANKMGLEVTAFTSDKSSEKAKQLQGFGAKHISSSVDLDQLKKEEGKYDLVLNLLYLNDSKIYVAHQRITKKKGTYVVIGIPNGTTPLIVDTNYMVMNSINFAGTLVGSIPQTIKMIELCAEHKIQPMVEKYSFDQFPKAFEKLEKGKPKYRCTVSVNGWAKDNGFDK